MIFADLATGDSVFVDANTLIYHFTPHPALGIVCRQLIGRIENQDLLGFTSTHLLGEVAHQLMIAEALTLPGWSLGKVKKATAPTTGSSANPDGLPHGSRNCPRIAGHGLDHRS